MLFTELYKKGMVPLLKRFSHWMEMEAQDLHQHVCKL